MITVVKAIHIIGFVSWFAGLFYLGRLFIYFSEAYNKPQGECKVLQAQFSIMQKRVMKIICNPAMFITLIFGLALAGHMRVMGEPWFHFKMLFVVALMAYHMVAGRIRRKLDEGVEYSPKFLRIFNELLTLLLIALVFLASTKSFLVTSIALAVTALFIALVFLILRKTLSN